MIEAHSKEEVEQAVEEESEHTGDLTKGHQILVCQECGRDIHWGNLGINRRGVGANSLMNFSDSENEKIYLHKKYKKITNKVK